MYATWRVWGDADDGDIQVRHDGITGYLAGEGLALTLEGPAADGAGPDPDAERACPECEWSGDLAECQAPDDDDDDGAHLCPECGAETVAPAATPDTWCNSLGVRVDPEENAVHLRVSLGDPRGAFVLTVRRLEDGRIIMHVPYPGQTFGHMPLAPMHEGTYEVGREVAAGGER